MERPKLKGRTVLVVEDEPLIAMDIVQVFEMTGAEVITATTLKQALILVEHDGLAVAIVDHSLDDGDSTALCLRLKERDIPYVICSGSTNISGIAAEAPVVAKPVRAEVLVTTVEGLLPEPVKS